MHECKCGIETVATAFTDHFAVVIRLTTAALTPDRGRGYWRMNVSILEEIGFHETLSGHWRKWQGHKRYYPSIILWWTRYVKPQLKKLFCWAGGEKRRERAAMETFYYAAIYEVIGRG